MSKSARTTITIQSIVALIATILTIATIIDIAAGHSSTSLWIAVVCWPIVIVLSVFQIVRARRQ